jgi:hypothetical protein
MNAAREIPIVSSDAGNPQVLANPTSAASIMKRALEQQSQTQADMKYDSPPPTRVESFQNQSMDSETTLLSLFLASSVLLFLYKVAPDV